MKLLRRALYYALWPLAALAYTLQGVINLFWFLIIVSNPLFLAIWLLNRDRRQPHTRDDPPRRRGRAPSLSRR